MDAMDHLATPLAMGGDDFDDYLAMRNAQPCIDAHRSWHCRDCAGLPDAKAFVLKTTPAITTISPIDWLAIKAQIRYFDFAFTAFVIMAIVALIPLSCSVWKAYIRRSYSWILPLTLMSRCIVSLPYATHNFDLNVSKRPSRLSICSLGPFGILMFTPNPGD
jgi:hypothetical protein